MKASDDETTEKSLRNIMRVALYLVIIFGLFACLKENSGSDKAVSAASATFTAEVHPRLHEKEVALIEAILNMPDVIRFSKIDLIRKKYHTVYILLDHPDMKDITSITQRGHSLHVLQNHDAVTEGRPCYVFDRIEIYNDSARVRMKFDITGAIAFGKSRDTNQKWVPEEEFPVGVR